MKIGFVIVILNLRDLFRIPPFFSVGFFKTFWFWNVNDNKLDNWKLSLKAREYLNFGGTSPESKAFKKPQKLKNLRKKLTYVARFDFSLMNGDDSFWKLIQCKDLSRNVS